MNYQLQLDKLDRKQLALLKASLTPKMTKYIPHIPTPKQAAFLLLDNKEAFYGGAAGGGKALDIETLIPTSDGYKIMKDVKAGDMVLSEYLNYIKVLAVSEIMYNRTCYEIIIEHPNQMKRVILVADAQHQWTLATGKIYTTEQIYRLQLKAKGAAIKLIKVKGKEQLHISKLLPTNSRPVKCIQVSSSTGIFCITGLMVPTHNSDALLMGALQYVDIPKYRAIIFRKTFADLALPGALMDRASEWLAPYRKTGEVRWIDKTKTWEFKKSGASLSFGYLESDKDKFRYQGAEFQYIAFDELTHIDKDRYLYLFSRLRRIKGSTAPLRMRGASNPGGMGHEWVKKRFVTEGISKGRIFIPAGLSDNPYLDLEEYTESLNNLDPITREQLLKGDWNVRREGGIFKREWFREIDIMQVPKGMKVVRYWDFASTDPTESKKARDPDYTAGAYVGEKDGFYYIIDIRRVRLSPYGVEQLVRNTAKADTRSVPVRIEQEPGSSGKFTTDKFCREVLKGYAAKGIRPTGKKVVRAYPLSQAAEQGRVFIVKAAWNEAFYEEAEVFPGIHDDQIDAVSGAISELDNIPNIFALPVSVGVSKSTWYDNEEF